MSISTLLSCTAIVGIPDPEPSGFRQGPDHTIDYGTDGAYFVDPVNGDDGNSGTVGSPFATIQKAVDTIGDNGTGIIRLRGGKYRQAWSLRHGQDKDNRVRILRYADEEVIVTGGEPQNGWTRCTVADEPVVGSNWANIFKVTVTNATTFPSGDPIEANIFENDVQTLICVGNWEGSNLGDKFFLQNVWDWAAADSAPGLTGGGLIESYTSAAVVAAYTADQLYNCTLIGHGSSNSSWSSKISSISGNTLTVADPSKAPGSNAEKKDRFALINLLPTLEQGQWGYVDHGTTSTLYLWPNDEANINVNIEVCARSTCVTATGRSYWDIEGIKFQQIARANPASQAAAAGFIYQGASSASSHATVKNCSFYGLSYAAVSSANKAAVKFHYHSHLIFEFNKIENVQGGWGLMCFGLGQLNPNEATTTFVTDNALRRNVIHRTSRTPIWLSGVLRAVCAHNALTQTGFAAHGNKGNFYQQSQDVLFWGNTYTDADGYLGWQMASGVNILFNHIPATRESNGDRALVAQQNKHRPPAEWGAYSGPCRIINNSLPPQPLAYDNSSDSGVSVGDDYGYTDVTYSIKNNILQGIVETASNSGTPDGSPRVTTSSNNWDTASTAPFTVDDVAMDGAANYTDPSAGDFTLKPTAPIRAETGDDISADITALQSTFGALFDDWDLDCLGNTIDHSAPRVGAVVDYDYSTLQSAAKYLILTP